MLFGRCLAIVVGLGFLMTAVEGGLFGSGLPPNGQLQLIVGGKCKFKICVFLVVYSKVLLVKLGTQVSGVAFCVG